MRGVGGGGSKSKAEMNKQKREREAKMPTEREDPLLGGRPTEMFPGPTSISKI